MICAVAEFWVIGQFTRRPLWFAIGMCLLNLTLALFQVAIGVYVYAAVCVVMACRHAGNARRLLRALAQSAPESAPT